MPESEHGDKPLSRNGSGVYSLPATYEAVTGETIEAQQHNDPLEDLEQDMNTARPIVAGGTGASTAVGGHDAFSTRGTGVASATTTDIGAASGMFVHITGTTTIEGFGTKTAGVKRILVFDDALTLTYNATSLILPGAANITTAAGDCAHMVSEGSGNWRCTAYAKADGTAIAQPDALAGESLTLTSTDAGASAAPVVILDRDSATPAASDVIGLVRFTGEDSAGNDQVYAEIEAIIVDPTTTEEDGKAVVRTTIAGTLADRLHVGAGTWGNGATGGDPGAGKANFTEVQVGGTAINLPVIGTEQATTSGTEFDYSSIPSWVNTITITFEEVSLDGTDSLLVQIGDSGGLETTGYESNSLVISGASAADAASTSGFAIALGNAGRSFSGHMVLKRYGTNKWSSAHMGVNVNGTNGMVGGGFKTLSATLDRLRITRTGSNAFDSGAVNIIYAH